MLKVDNKDTVTMPIFDKTKGKTSYGCLTFIFYQK